MAYKSLNDGIRLAALEPFLQTANRLPGLLVIYAVPVTVRSLFVANRYLKPSEDLEFEPLRKLNSKTAEKLMRVVNLLGVLLAGISESGQDVLWVTDDDSIAANRQRVKDLCTALAHSSSHCLSHSLGHLRVATASQDAGDRSFEDLLAIADIATGGLARCLEEMLGAHGAPPSGFYLPPVRSVAGKTREVMDWFSDNTQPLRRFVIVLDEPAGAHLRGTHLKFHGSRDQQER